MLQFLVGYAAPGGFSGSGNGKFVTIDTSRNGTAVAFDQGDLKNAPLGELKAILDINFTEALFDQPDSQNFLKNLIQSNATPRKFTYDSKFNQLTSKTDELGHQTLYQIDPNNGNLLSLTQVVGAVGGDDDLVTKFTYTDKGLVDLITKNTEAIAFGCGRAITLIMRILEGRSLFGLGGRSFFGCGRAIAFWDMGERSLLDVGGAIAFGGCGAIAFWGCGRAISG